MKKWKAFVQDERGISTVEVILLLFVIIIPSRHTHLYREGRKIRLFCDQFL